MSSASELRLCRNCGHVFPQDEFALKNRNTGTRATRCRQCVRAYSAEHYQENRAKYIERAKESNRKIRQLKRSVVADLRNQPCMDCGNLYPPCCMEFDHRSGRQISGRNSPEAIANLKNDHSSVAELYSEIEKCDVVCRNCHAIRTDKRRQEH